MSFDSSRNQTPKILFDLAAIKLQQEIGQAENVDSLQLKINEKLANAIAIGPFQNFEKRGNDFVLLLGERFGKKAPATDRDVAENLKPTIEFPSDHPAIVNLTREAVGNETDPKRKVQRLVKFVSRYIEDTLDDNALNALAVCKNKKGDCSEHALLFTAMARAAGVPCRSVGGFIYGGDDMKAFTGHAWNEVILDGHWYPVDSSWEEFTINPTHIQLKDDQQIEFLSLGMDAQLLELKSK